jgi:hypothetical protein
MKELEEDMWRIPLSILSFVEQQNEDNANGLMSSLYLIQGYLKPVLLLKVILYLDIPTVFI